MREVDELEVYQLSETLSDMILISALRASEYENLITTLGPKLNAFIRSTQ